MVVSTISFWFPLMFAAAIALFWRYTWKAPINHWLICLLVFAINFFWFSYVFIIFLIIAIFKSGILKSLMNNKDDKGTE
jgi:hypothetical protein